MRPEIDLPIRAATETAAAHGIVPDRCDILQNGSTRVLRLSETLVARVVTDLDGPRQGGEWFARESAVAQHLASYGAPVIPMHPGIPPGPHEHLGYTLNFWQYVTSIDVLGSFQLQPLHGDAHLGNPMNTTLGLLWTDWEDTFLGPVEWDLASIIWNARILDEDHETADLILKAYRLAGGHIDPSALHHSLIARAAVMSAWNPVLYPDPSPERRTKLQLRLDWLTEAANLPLPLTFERPGKR